MDVTWEMIPLKCPKMLIMQRVKRDYELVRLESIRFLLKGIEFSM